MNTFGDRLNKMRGRTRFVVCRLFLQLAGAEVAPFLGVLNEAARESIEASGELEATGEALVKICQSLLELDAYWQAAANEGDVFWEEGEAGDYFTELFTDSAERYLSDHLGSDTAETDEPFVVPVTQNLVVMITAAYEGEVPALETDLSEAPAFSKALKALMNLHYQHHLRAIQVHFSPAQLGEELSDEQLIENFPELIPL